MKAVQHIGYGDPARAVRLEEIEKPTAGPAEVLVRMRASSVNSLECRVVRPSPLAIRVLLGLRRPKLRALGTDAAGVVEAVGQDVNDLAPGDEVFGHGSGAFAEYANGTNFVRKPAALTFEQAAALPVAGLAALQAVRDHGSVRAGQHVLINGAGGGVGHLAVQIAKALGAEVTAVTSTDKLDMVRSLGADHVVDRTRADFTRAGLRYDAIVDCSGDHSFRATGRVLAAEGTLVIVGAHKGVLRRALMGTLRRRLLKQRIAFFVAKVRNDDLLTLAELAQAGKLTPVIDRTYPLAETAAAIAYAEAQQASGKVVISI